MQLYPKTIDVCVLNELGLHARPAGILAREAQKYAASITLSQGDRSVDAKSILDILSLAASQGTELAITAEGQDADDALRNLTDFFANKFGEDR